MTRQISPRMRVAGFMGLPSSVPLAFTESPGLYRQLLYPNIVKRIRAVPNMYDVRNLVTLHRPFSSTGERVANSSGKLNSAPGPLTQLPSTVFETPEPFLS